MGFGIEKFIGGKAKLQASESIGFVEEYARYLDSVVDEPREGFHISQLWRFCPLRWVLERVFQRGRKIPYALRYRFDVGRALHEMVQGHLGGMGLLKGIWRCDKGHETPISVQPLHCPSCGAKRLRYKEVEVGCEVEAGFRIVGRTDGVICWKGEDLGLEVKSVDAGRLPYLNAPDDYPVFQLNLYMRCLRESHFPGLKRGMVLYISWPSKETILLPAKAFLVDYSDAPWKEALSKVREAIAMWRAWEGGNLPVSDLLPKRVCRTEADGRKAECGVVSECFNSAVLAKTFGG